jgi:hypothetical protein
MAAIGEITFRPQGVYHTLTTALRAGHPYHFTVTVYKRVKSCEGQDFEALYTRANEIGRARVQTFTCPTGCAPLDAIEVARIWNCKDNVAWASAKYLVICPAKPETYSHVGRAAGFDRPAMDPPKATFDDVNEVFLTTLTKPVRMTCKVGTARWFSHLFDYTEYDRDSTEYHGETDPLEARAQAAAELASQFGLFDCNPPCRLHIRTKIVGRQRKAEIARLRVKIEVDCS